MLDAMPRTRTIIRSCASHAPSMWSVPIFPVSRFRRKWRSLLMGWSSPGGCNPDPGNSPRSQPDRDGDDTDRRVERGQSRLRRPRGGFARLPAARRQISRLLPDLHHSRSARIRVAGGGAGGDAPDAQASAEAVSRKARCPVLTVKHPFPETSSGEPTA